MQPLYKDDWPFQINDEDMQFCQKPPSQSLQPPPAPTYNSNEPPPPPIPLALTFQSTDYINSSTECITSSTTHL